MITHFVSEEATISQDVSDFPPPPIGAHINWFGSPFVVVAVVAIFQYDSEPFYRVYMNPTVE